MKIQQGPVFIVLTCVSVLCQAADGGVDKEQYLGAGLSRISINSGHPSIGDQTVSGFGVQFAFRNRNHVFELATGGADGLDVGPTYEIYYPEDSADYMYFSLSYIYQFRNFLPAYSVIPYLGGGWHLSSVNWNTYVYDHTGEGFAFVAGVILPVEQRWLINLSVRRLEYSGERLLFSFGDYDNYTTVANEFSVSLLYRFNLDDPSCGVFFC